VLLVWTANPHASGATFAFERVLMPRVLPYIRWTEDRAAPLAAAVERSLGLLAAHAVVSERSLEGVPDSSLDELERKLLLERSRRGSAPKLLMPPPQDDARVRRAASSSSTSASSPGPTPRSGSGDSLRDFVVVGPSEAAAAAAATAAPAARATSSPAAPPSSTPPRSLPTFTNPSFFPTRGAVTGAFVSPVAEYRVSPAHVQQAPHVPVPTPPTGPPSSPARDARYWGVLGAAMPTTPPSPPPPLGLGV